VPPAAVRRGPFGARHHARWRRKLSALLRDEFREEDVERLLAGSVIETFRRPAVLYSPGDVSEQVYVLLSGVLVRSLFTPDGARIIVQLLGPGAFFGLCAFRRGCERQFHAEAFTDVQVAAMSRDHLVSVLARMGPRGHAALLARHAETMSRLAHRQMALVALPTRERVLSVLQEVGLDFGVRDTRGVIIDLRLTHETLAALAGASRQRVSVALGELARSGVITRDGARIVLRRGARPRGPRRPAALDSPVS
jgi:CRP-like cAMP-binding protein